MSPEDYRYLAKHCLAGYREHGRGALVMLLDNRTKHERYISEAEINQILDRAPMKILRRAEHEAACEVVASYDPTAEGVSILHCAHTGLTLAEVVPLSWAKPRSPIEIMIDEAVKPVD